MHPHPLWIIRHGQTEWNLQARWQGRLDSPLTTLGKAQAARVGERLLQLGLGGVPMLSSPQGRAVQSAAIIAAALGRPAPPTDDRLCEINVGDWTGLTRSDIEARLGGPWDRLLAPYEAAPGGEGVAGLSARVDSLLGAVSGPVILVTHGITSRVLRTRALGLPSAQAEALPGGQGVIHHVEAGQHVSIDAQSGAAETWVGGEGAM